MWCSLDASLNYEIYPQKRKILMMTMISNLLKCTAHSSKYAKTRNAMHLRKTIKVASTEKKMLRYEFDGCCTHRYVFKFRYIMMRVLVYFDEFLVHFIHCSLIIFARFSFSWRYFFQNSISLSSDTVAEKKIIATSPKL